MPLNKQERKQLNRYLDAITEGAAAPTGPSETKPGEQGAPPAGVIDYMNQILGQGGPGPGESQADYDRAVRERAENLQRGTGAQTFNGVSGVKASDLSPADLVFMRHLHENAAHRHQQAGRSSPDVFEALLVGSQAQIVAARNGSQDRADVQGERSKFAADPAAWVRDYSSPNSQKLRDAYNKWISGQGV